MKDQKITSWILLISLAAPYVNAANINQKSVGNCSPNVVAKGHVTIHCGLSKEEVEIIVAKYTEKHHLSDEEVAALTVAIFALGQGIGKLGSNNEVNTAIAELLQWNIDKAKTLFLREAKRQEKLGKRAVKRSAEAYRNLGALAALDNPQQAIQAYQRATELDPNNLEGWNKLGYLLKMQFKLDDSIKAYQKALALEKKHKNQRGIAETYYNLGVTHNIQFYKLVDEPLTSKLIDDPFELYLQIQEKIQEAYYEDKEFKPNIEQLKQLDNAIAMHGKALAIEIKENNRNKMDANYLQLKFLYNLRGDKNKSEEMDRKRSDYFELVHRKNSRLHHLSIEFEKANKKNDLEKMKSLVREAQEKGILPKTTVPDSVDFKGKGFFEILKESFKEFKFKLK
ncbi:MAG: tetratricopeptide repeat protein [Proteobacteria bacterium]|nr:tetratricopeptide repeat protein [Pseudomonadota bacterium]